MIKEIIATTMFLLMVLGGLFYLNQRGILYKVKLFFINKVFKKKKGGNIMEKAQRPEDVKPKQTTELQIDNVPVASVVEEPKEQTETIAEEIQGLRDNGVFRWQLLNLLASINKNLEELKKK